MVFMHAPPGMHIHRTLDHTLLTWKQQARPTHSYLPFPFETGVAVALVLAQEEAVGSVREIQSGSMQ